MKVTVKNIFNANHAKRRIKFVRDEIKIKPGGEGDIGADIGKTFKLELKPDDGASSDIDYSGIFVFLDNNIDELGTVDNHGNKPWDLYITLRKKGSPNDPAGEVMFNEAGKRLEVIIYNNKEKSRKNHTVEVGDDPQQHVKS